MVCFFLVFCGEADSRDDFSEQKMRGRHFVQFGEFTTVSGTLKTEFGEWFLVDNNIVYEIHMGDHRHRQETGVKLEEGKKATVTGFLYVQEGHDNIDIAVCTVEMDGEKYRFRSDAGVPLWRGRGTREGHKQGL